MGALVLTDIHPDDFRRYRLGLEQKGLATHTVRHVLSDARRLFAWAVENQHVVRSPFPRRIMPRLQETSPDRLTDAEVAAVLAVPEPQAFVVRLGLGTGLRWAEMCRARATDIEQGMLVVRQTKSGRIRRVPLSPELRAEIMAKPGRLVPYAMESPGGLSRYVARRSGVERFHVHQLRHTFACRWIEDGGTLPALQQILGHASVITTQRYARLSDEAVRREAERIHASRALAKGMR